MFDAAAGELRDEVNVPLEHQHEPELLGVVRDLAHGGRCGLEFLIKLKVGSGNKRQCMTFFAVLSQQFFPFLTLLKFLNSNNKCSCKMHAVLMVEG